jgi:hypothetical protein
MFEVLSDQMLRDRYDSLLAIGVYEYDPSRNYDAVGVLTVVCCAVSSLCSRNRPRKGPQAQAQLRVREVPIQRRTRAVHGR